jgi:hypothetical protein
MIHRQTGLVHSYDDVPPYPSATRSAIRPSSARDPWRLCGLESLVGRSGGVLRDDGQACRSHCEAAHHHVDIKYCEHDLHDGARDHNDDRTPLRADDHRFHADDDHDNTCDHHDGTRDDNDDRAHLLHVALGRAGVQLR